ncbi:uncharacterized protein [Rhodnius prolixus]|uniref:uncharacterized protein n=1 Tax=Rhodnius prolixus TaxID=13249 RepID=UPI003D18C556
MRAVLLLQIFCSSVLLQFVNSIDENEQLGYCEHNININVIDHIIAYEGVWFPQYRSRAAKNYQYTCHTLYERVFFEEKPKLLMDSYYTLNGIPQTESYLQNYSPGEKRGIIVDDEGNLEGYGPYKVYNYILKLTPQYRVRYLCTDYIKASKNITMVYIETRQMTPKWQAIKLAVNVLQENGLYVNLDRIEQSDCKRPLGPEGYEPLDQDLENISKPYKP